MGNDFFQKLAGFSQFSQLCEPAYYAAAPADWHVVTTDVRHSTQAIEQGKYKEINLSGAAVIMSVLNISRDTAIPYAFGGDGATMLIPPSLLDDTLSALAAVQQRVQAAFGLELRAGCVPVHSLYDAGCSLLVGKFFLSPTVSQAVFQGNALAQAEQWLKHGGGNVRLAHPTQHADANLQGLECRWQPLENRHGKIVSLLVRVAASHENRSWQLYAEMLADIESIYPQHASSHPSHTGNLRLSFSPKTLMHEVKMRQSGLLARALYLLKIVIINSLGHYSFTTRKPVGNFDGQRYLQEMVANSDSRKFDEMLRMVLDSTQAQHEKLEAMLKERHTRGEIHYGIHESPQALMTCLVFSLSGNHVHLVDGSDGGYALAAKRMKQQMNEAA